MIAPTHKDLLISTPNTGKEVRFSPHLREDGLMLKRAARQGLYYPMLVMKHLNALSTGLNGKHNVFIPNIKDFKSNTFQKVVVFVPGIKATVERRPNDSLVVTKLELSEGYDSITKGRDEKPGVYQARKVNGEFKLTYKNNGRITAKDDRNVVVANTKYDSLLEAAKGVGRRLEAMFSSDVAVKGDFDLFYSPVGSKLGDMWNYNPVVITQGYAFAGLLADAMEQAKNQKGVVWSSEEAGSVVLTQSLQALASKGVTFKDQNHIVKMYLATTNAAPALAATRQLGMIADKKMANGNIRGIITNVSRAMDSDDHYSMLDMAKEISDGTAFVSGGVGALALGTSAMIGASPVLVTVGTVTGTVGALHFALKAFQNIKHRVG